MNRILFQVEPKGSLDLDGTKQGNITLTLTIPFACPSSKSCPLFVRTYIPRTNNLPCEITTLKTSRENCGVEFPNIKDSRFIQTKHLSIQAVVGLNRNAFDQDFAIFLQVVNKYHPFLHNNILHPIRVSLICRTIIINYIIKRISSVCQFILNCCLTTRFFKVYMHVQCIFFKAVTSVCLNSALKYETNQIPILKNYIVLQF